MAGKLAKHNESSALTISFTFKHAHAHLNCTKIKLSKAFVKVGGKIHYLFYQRLTLLVSSRSSKRNIWDRLERLRRGLFLVSNRKKRSSLNIWALLILRLLSREFHSAKKSLVRYMIFIGINNNQNELKSIALLLCLFMLLSHAN